MHRLVLTRNSIRYLLLCAALLLVGAGWLAGDYLLMRLKKQEVQQLRAETEAHKDRLSALHQRAKDIQRLLGDWKDLHQRLQASLPPQRRSPANNHHPVAELETSLASLEKELKHLTASIPLSWPANGRVTSGVGTRPSPWTGAPEFHAGLDIQSPTGAPVYAAGDAVVELVGESNGNGRIVVLNHGQGITTQYAHLSASHVKKGERVHKGQRIASVGNTGKTTSPHLHYEVRVHGVPIDPRSHLIK